MIHTYGRTEDVTYLEDEVLADLTNRIGLKGEGDARQQKPEDSRRRAVVEEEEEEEENGKEMEVKTREEACRLLRVLSEDLGLRADIQAIREGEQGSTAASTSAKGASTDEPSLTF